LFFKHTVFTKLALILLNYIKYNHQPIVEQSIYVKLTWLQCWNWLYSSLHLSLGLLETFEETPEKNQTSLRNYL